MSYVITKGTQIYNGGKGYDGPSCELAGVEPAHIYRYFCEAATAAQELREVNPVSWEIRNYIPLKEFETNL